MYFPMWPCWFREQGPGANPEACDTVLNRFTLGKDFKLTELQLMQTFLASVQIPVNLVAYLLARLSFRPKTAPNLEGWMWKFTRGKNFILHGRYVQSLFESFPGVGASRPVVA